MRLRIIRIEENVVTCEIDGDTLIDIGRIWFNQDIHVDDEIEFDVIDKSKKIGEK